MKMKASAVCARAQVSIFMVFWPFSPKKCHIVEEVWTMTEQVVKSKYKEDKPRSGWLFFHKMCEKYYRKSCKYMRNNSTKQKGKNISTSHYRSKFRAQRYGDKLPKTVESLKEKKAVHTSCKRGVRRICQLHTKGGPAGKLMWCEPPRDHLDSRRQDNIQRSSPKTLDELSQWLCFAWKNVTLDTLWELVQFMIFYTSPLRKCQKICRKTFWLLIF